MLFRSVEDHYGVLILVESPIETLGSRVTLDRGEGFVAIHSRSNFQSTDIHEPFEPVLELLTEVPDNTVLCSHGDIIPATIAALERRGMEITSSADWRKASVWVIKRSKRGNISKAKAWPPPQRGSKKH